MDAIREFINMGGYGGYVWPCYLVTALVMVVMLVVSMKFLKTNEATIQSLEPSKEDKAGEEKT